MTMLRSAPGEKGSGGEEEEAPLSRVAPWGRKCSAVQGLVGTVRVQVPLRGDRATCRRVLSAARAYPVPAELAVGNGAVSVKKHPSAAGDNNPRCFLPVMGW